MLWCKDFLFVHYPKTAGKTLTRFFVQAWPRPISGYISKGQVQELHDCDLEETGIVVGRGHENLMQSKKIIEAAGENMSSMKGIFCCIRNPYDLMVSNYHFMRETFHANTERRNFVIAHENSFVDFCEKVGVTTPKNWMTIDDSIPENLQIIRFEQMNSDLNRLAKTFNFDVPQLAHLNASKRAHYSEYMCVRAEEAIAEKFAFWFEQGYYDREEFGKKSAVKIA